MSAATEIKADIAPEAKKMKLDIVKTTTAVVASAGAKSVLRWAKLTDQAFEPVRGSTRAAGLDLRSAYDINVPARGHTLVKTDIQIQVPEGTYGRIAPRSGLALKNAINVGAGVVDEDYRGNVGVILFNHADEEFVVKRGDRIAQLICEKIMYPELEQAEKLSDTERGAGGFGSTGVAEEGKKEENGSAKQNGAENGNGVAKKETDDAKAEEDSAKTKAAAADEDVPMTEQKEETAVAT